jgi:hypothetical protein
MKKKLHSECLQKGDEVWIVIDRDSWEENQLDALYKWSQEKECYGFALSNPSFELWLLLHFEEGNGVGSKRECLQRLKKHLPGFDKARYDLNRFKDKVKDAVENAEQKDRPPCKKWPDRVGSTVYRLVKKLITESPNRTNPR